MHFGIYMFPTDTAIAPADLARAVEERGFESLWLPEHSHIPTSRRSPWGGVTGAPPLPEMYWRTNDQLVSLAMAAAVTTTLKLATGITLVAQRDPIWLAKEVATLDHLSGGRVIFGVGYGWNREEMEQHGVDPSTRRALLREKVLLMRRLWAEDEASFEGEYLHLEPSWAWPKPAQKPHPPIVLGGAAGPTSIAHMVEFCDGWMPLGRHELGPKIDLLHQALTDAGREPASFELSFYGAPPKRIDELVSQGFARIIFNVTPGSVGDVLAQLDEYRTVADSYS